MKIPRWPPEKATFAEVVELIQAARQRAFQAVNTELIELYWRVGEYVTCKIEAAEWGDIVVEQLALYLARTQLGLRRFTRPNIFRMRQFYSTYRKNRKVSALLRQLPWTHHLLILGQCKFAEGREITLES